MGIAGMVIWALTAGIGIYLLAVGIGTQRAAGLARARADAATAATAQADSTAAEAAGRTAAEASDGTGAPAPAGADATTVGAQALAVVMSGGAAPAAPPIEGSPLLEFTHPALALLGLTFWIFFVMTGDRLFAWIAFGVLLTTVTAGLSWELSRRRNARQRAAHRVPAGPGGGQDSGGQDSAVDGPGFPPHLVLAHGAAAACTFVLVVIAAVAAGHG